MNNDFKNYNYDSLCNYKKNYIVNNKKSLDDILEINIGKKISIYESFDNSNEWKDKIFTGILEKVDNEYIILSDPTNNTWYIILIKYINYIKFDEEINTSNNFYSPNY